MSVQSHSVRWYSCRCCTWAALLLVIHSFRAFSAFPATPQYVFRAYRQAEGLDNLTVSALAFDRQGFLWVGTQNGLYRFLGSTFQRFGAAEGIPEPVIEDILVTSDGIVWVGTLQNLYRWTGERFVAAAPHPIHTWRSGRLAAESPGTLLIADSTSRLFRLTYRPGGSFVSYTPLVSPYFKSLGSIAVQNAGTFWIGCQNRICQSTGTSVKQWGEAEGVPGEYCYALRFDPRGSLWATTEHHVLELPPGASRFLDRTEPELANTGIYHRQPIAIDSQGRVLVSAGKRLFRWQDSNWLVVGPNNGFGSVHAGAMAFDSNGDLWIGTSGQGLTQWTGYRSWEGWSETQGLPSANIWSLGLFTQGKAYVGTETGPASIDLGAGDHGAVQRLFSDSDWPYGQVGGIVQDLSGVLWAGTKTGAILRLDPVRRGAKLLTTLPTVVLKMALDPTGRVLVLCKRGMYSFHPASTAARTVAPIRVEPVDAVDSLLGSPQRIAGACQSPDGALSFAASRAVFQLRSGVWSILPISGLGSEPLSWNDLTCAPDGSFWLLDRDYAIWHLTLHNGRFDAVPMKLPQQFGSVASIAILADRRNWLWLGTDVGVFTWTGKAWCHFTQESGLIWNDVNTAGLAEAPDGSIWIGTSGGLAHLSNPADILSAAPLPISLIDVRRGNQPVLASSGLTFPWAGHDLSFRFASPSVLNRSDLRFRYRIPQIQSSWFETRDSFANFVALPPGSFTFEVQAFNPGSGAASPVLSRDFRILPPWWRTVWFYALCALVFTLCLAIFYRLRTRHLFNQRNKLEALIRERTLELEASREHLRIQANQDSLTQLPNRPAILSRLNREVARALHENSPLTIVLVDIDHFKSINDTFGHLAGDEALRSFAAALSGCIRFTDCAGRYGGEEFLVLLTDVPAPDLDQRLAHLHRGISNLTVRYEEVEFRINCSLGAVSFSPSDHDVSHILAAADHALYQAKKAGRNRVVHHEALKTETAA